MRRLLLLRESWPIRGTFTISRGSKNAADVVVAEVHEGDRRGRGECVPYPRYDESVESVVEQIEALRREMEAGVPREELQGMLAPGAARNALDCALWDLEAKTSGRRAWEIADIPAPGPAVTAVTLSLEEPESMAARARALGERPLLKLKLGAPGDIDRVRAVREEAPRSRLIVDANEAWSPETLQAIMADLAELDVALIEQPLPAGDDEALAGMARPVPVCADESCHDSRDLAGLAGRYDAINIKLDKTGGLTEALLLADAAKRDGFGLMVGCMIATSLAMAPALLLASRADFVDLDGPLLLARDREHGLAYRDGSVHPPSADLWG